MLDQRRRRWADVVQMLYSAGSTLWDNLAVTVPLTARDHKVRMSVTTF